MELVNRAARDHARTPMQWSDGTQAGFCPADIKSWFAENPSHLTINVARDEMDQNSVLSFYCKAIRLRCMLPVVREGSYRAYKRASGVLYVYARDGR